MQNDSTVCGSTSRRCPSNTETTERRTLHNGRAVTAIEKKSYFDKVSHKISPRIQQLLNGSSNADDPEKLLLNSNIQNFLKTFEEKFSKGADMIFTRDFQRQIEKNLGEEQITNVMVVIFQVHGTIHLVKKFPHGKTPEKHPKSS